MASFWADSVSLSYANVELAKQWWIQANRRWHKCPPDWDNPLPSDVALKFFACDEPILLCAQGEVERAGFDRPSPVVSTIFCDQLKKAHERLSVHRISPGLIQDGDDIEFFEIRDIEGNVMQICQESCNATLAFGVTDKCIPDRVQL